MKVKNAGVCEGLRGVRKHSDEHTASFHQIVFHFNKDVYGCGYASTYDNHFVCLMHFMYSYDLNERRANVLLLITKLVFPPSPLFPILCDKIGKALRPWQCDALGIFW